MDSFSGLAVDVWSLGVTLYCMTFNQLPFWDDSEYNLFQKIHKEEYIFPRVNFASFRLKLCTNRVISDDLRSLIMAMLDKNPETRVKTEELEKHSFFKS